MSGQIAREYVADHANRLSTRAGWGDSVSLRAGRSRAHD